jgi:DNA-binding NtrC family response regulator
MRLSQPAGTQVILLADSDVFVRNLLCRELTREGYFVLTGSNCDDALRLSSNFEGVIDLLLANSDIPERGTCTDAIVRERPQMRMLLISVSTHEGLIQRSREKIQWSTASLPAEVRAKIREAIADPHGATAEI